MDDFAEQNLNEFQDQGLLNEVHDQFLGFSCEEEKLPYSQLPSEIRDHKILSDIQNLEHLNNAQKVEENLSIKPPDKFSIEIENRKHQSGVQDQEKLPTEIHIVEKKKLDNETQDGHQDISASEPFVYRRSRVTPPMPSEDTMRHSIADNLMEILVNMTNPQYRQQCFELLQVSDALQARSRILDILQRIDEKRRIR